MWQDWKSLGKPNFGKIPTSQCSKLLPCFRNEHLVYLVDCVYGLVFLRSKFGMVRGGSFGERSLRGLVPASPTALMQPTVYRAKPCSILSAHSVHLLADILCAFVPHNRILMGTTQDGQGFCFFYPQVPFYESCVVNLSQDVHNVCRETKLASPFFLQIFKVPIH